MWPESPDGDTLAGRFEASRPRLRAVAYRMLGSYTEAEDAVQEAWLRLNRAGGAVDNLDAWLTTVVGRVCLDVLRSRTRRAEQPLDERWPGESGAAGDPEDAAVLADSLGLALLVVLDTLTPLERLAFVLHDLFAVPFEEIAPVVGRSPAAARQLASRARRRVQDAATPEADPGRQRELVSAFLAASRDGDFDGLLAVLDPDVVVRGDEVMVQRGGGVAELRGAEAVARSFLGRARVGVPAVLDGLPGVAIMLDGRLFIALRFAIVDGRIAGIEAIGDRDRLDSMTVER
jgi:RNA polymerase sigma-70 factor (ECF subfamily)